MVTDQEKKGALTNEIQDRINSKEFALGICQHIPQKVLQLEAGLEELQAILALIEEEK